jgi:hypothetical protein
MYERSITDAINFYGCSLGSPVPWERLFADEQLGLIVSFDMQAWSDGEATYWYMSRLMIGERFSDDPTDRYRHDQDDT